MRVTMNDRSESDKLNGRPASAESEFAERLIEGTAVSPVDYLNERSGRALERYREFLAARTKSPNVS